MNAENMAQTVFALSQNVHMNISTYQINTLLKENITFAMWGVYQFGHQFSWFPIFQHICFWVLPLGPGISMHFVLARSSAIILEHAY